MELTKTDRRTFLRRGAMGAGALWAVSLQELAARRKRGGIALAIPSPYGPISPKIDESTGLPLIMLPDGFRYWSLSWTGDMMSDGVRVPEPARRHGGSGRDPRPLQPLRRPAPP